MYAQCRAPEATWALSGGYPRPGGSKGSSWCGPVVFFILLILGVWWLCSKPGGGEAGAASFGRRLPVLVEEEDELLVVESGPAHLNRLAARQEHPQLRKLYGDMMGGSGREDPGVQRQQHPGIAAGATVPLDVAAPLVASFGGLNMPGSVAAGTSLAGAYDMSDTGKEYLAAYNPTGLASVMPAGWRSDAAGPGKCASTGDGSYAEFSRYSITPEAVARSENMRGVMRLSENTRQGLGRTLGYQSLLRNYVTPVGPQPIGDKSMLWNDSSVRQSYIAAVQGSFPPLGLC